MTSTMKILPRIMIGVGAMAALSVAGTFPGAGQGHAAPAVGKQAVRQTQEGPSPLALRYAEALTNGRVAQWAGLDLGCLTRARHRNDSNASGATGAQACWDETMKAHRTFVMDETEPGIFGAVGRGVGFGLLAEQHRVADSWKEYPPGVFVSPTVIKKTAGSVVRIEVSKVWPAQRLPLQMAEGQPPASVDAVKVDIKVIYPDPFTAPLALRPGEIWWASGQIRRYGPVKELVTRFVLVSGLQKLGYPVDQAVINEALPGTPLIPGTRYGIDPDNIGRTSVRAGASDPTAMLGGGLVLGSAQWWDRALAGEKYDSGVLQAEVMTASDERNALITRLLLLDPSDPRVNKILGNDQYLVFLRKGLLNSGINAEEEALRLRLAELYWTLQAGTWRQELTEVATGHSVAADSFYPAMKAFELAITGGQGTPEMRRRLGALYRWNNDEVSALALHEGLLKEAGADPRRRGRALSEIAWDRVQWLAWNRQYTHPWVEQTRQEATEALGLVESPVEKLIAVYARVMLEALSISRQPGRIEEDLRIAKGWLDQIPGQTGVWSYLVGNDVVKALIPEGSRVVLASPPRSLEVLDVKIHAEVPAQDIFRSWNFDAEPPGQAPGGFRAKPAGPEQPGAWRIAADPKALSAPNVLSHASACRETDCFELLVTEMADFEFPDVTVNLQIMNEGQGGGAGIALLERGSSNYYAVALSQVSSTVTIYRVQAGQAVPLESAPVKLSGGGWHVLRVQRSNSVNVSRSFLAVFVDGMEVRAVSDDALPAVDRVALFVKGGASARFDSLRALNLVSNQAMSKPAAY